jgi:hypothetical protein
LDQAVECGFRTARCFVERALVRKEIGDRAGALKDIWDAVALENIGSAIVLKLVSVIRRTDKTLFQQISNSPAFKSLNSTDRVEVAEELDRSRAELSLGADLLEPVVENKSLNSELLYSARTSLLLCLIGLGRLERAVSLVQSAFPILDDLPIEFAFNFAMAEWGVLKHPNPESFARVIRLDHNRQSPARLGDPNYLQCLAVANWAIGDVTAAGQRVASAAQRIRELGRASLSCWRYLNVPVKEFLSDCQAIRRLIDGEDIVPEFFGPD